ncbi:exonuclease SbcD [Psychromicrobium silvestre]|uniref:Nuclease SbcCD subunit D n=1 Tax=Psychromicrobium silvestre TaxID=1645614 RepID=A0A7Y9S604_9MICC|nr:exonuclease SbcCD subunit D [Psychromicrobium silvestre]NYE94760.1 exonuclease SbcD [Psychromicrobium silvestre]
MRLLHTSDWHLGRSFHGVGLLGAQQRFIEQLLATVRESAVEVVLISGDVYDRAMPSVDAVRLFSSTLARIREAGAQIVLSSGNHDSAGRLGFAAEVLGHGGVHIRAEPKELARPVLFPLEAGAATAQLAIYGVPYLEPRLVADELDLAEPDHQSAMAAALARIRADLAERPGTRSLVLAHTFASGALSSESERQLSGMRSGGIGAVPLDLFDGFDYVALGHLHGRQQLSPSVRYSGSPLAYSFSEAGQYKGGWLLEIDQDGVQSVEAVSWPAERGLAILRGTLTELLEDQRFASFEDAYCQVTLTDSERPLRAMDRIRERFAQTLVLEFEPESRAASSRSSYADRIAAAGDDLEICTGFLEHVRAAPANEAERQALHDAVDAVRAEQVSE